MGKNLAKIDENYFSSSKTFRHTILILLLAVPCTNLSVTVRVNLLVDVAQVVVKQRVPGPSPQHSGVVLDSLAPPTLESTEVGHVGVGIDVVFFDGERLTIAALSLLWSV